MCNFRVGHKIICIREGNLWGEKEGELIHPGPKKDEIVTVGGFFNGNDTDFVWTIEYGWKYTYHTKYFRPLEYSYTEEELASVDISPLIEELELETV